MTRVEFSGLGRTFGKALRPAFYRYPTVLATTIFVGGCIPRPPEVAESVPSSIRETPADPTYRPSVHASIGQVAWVDPGKQRAIILLRLNQEVVNAVLVSRNRDLEFTAVLQPIGFRRERSVAVWISSGSPMQGDDVFPADASLSKKVIDFLATGKGPH